MDVQVYVRVLWRRLWLIALGAALCGIVAHLESQRMVPTYEASTTLFVHQPPVSTNVTGYNELFDNDTLLQTVAELLCTRPILEDVVARLNLDTAPDLLAKKITVSISRGTQLIVVSVVDNDPQRAATIANAIPNVFRDHNYLLQTSTFAASKARLEQDLADVQQKILETQASINALKPPPPPVVIAPPDAVDPALDDATDPELDDATPIPTPIPTATPDTSREEARLRILLDQYTSSQQALLQNLERLRLVEAQPLDVMDIAEVAQPPRDPIIPRPRLYVAIGAIIGAMLMAGVVVIVEYFNDTLRTEDDVRQRTGLVSLGTIDSIDGWHPTDTLVTVLDAHSPLAETYRLIAARIAFSDTDPDIRSVLITSAGPSEGKSTTAANLAVALAQIGKQVILVDANLRNPGLHQLFHQPSNVGVATALTGDSNTPIDDHLLPLLLENLRLMTVGTPQAGEALHDFPLGHRWSSKMARLIKDLRGRADFVIFDGPSLLENVDATLLAHNCDAVVLVTRAASTKVDALRYAIDQLGQARVLVLGVILNRVRARRTHGIVPRASSQRREPDSGTALPPTTPAGRKRKRDAAT